MNHIRLENHYAPDLRKLEARYLHGHRLRPHRAQSRRAPHRDDHRPEPLRPLQHPEHRHLPLVPRRLEHHRHSRHSSIRRHAGADCYRFSSLGMDIPLFHKAITPSLASPIDTPPRQSRRTSRPPAPPRPLRRHPERRRSQLLRPRSNQQPAGSPLAAHRSTRTRSRSAISPDPTAPGPTFLSRAATPQPSTRNSAASPCLLER
jgi:hypothetical protein